MSDTTAPTVAITSASSGQIYAAFTCTFTFSEDVTGFALGDITVSANAGAGTFNAVSASVYTAVITPTASGTVTVSVAANVCIDAAGNNNTASNTFSIFAWVGASWVGDDIAGNDGDAITTWTSSDAGAYAITQASASQKPALKKAANGINGHNVVRFDGGDLLRLGGANLFNDSQGTFAFVYRFNGSLPASISVIFSSGDEATTSSYLYICADGIGAPVGHVVRIVQRNASDTADDVIGNTVLQADTVYVVIARSDGSAYSLRVNGTEQTLAVQGGANNGDWLADTTLRDNFVAGALKRSTEVAFFAGDLAEKKYTSEYISGAALTQLENYLNTKYRP